MHARLKRRLITYGIANEEYRVAHCTRVAFDTSVDMARSLARLRIRETAKHAARIGLLGIRAGLAAVNLVALKRAEAGLPPEVTHEVVVIEDAPETWPTKPDGDWLN